MRAARILAVILAATALCGCWGGRETDEIAYVMSMGFDKGPGDNITVTFQIANPRAIAGQTQGGGAGGKPLINISTIAPLPIGAFNLVNTERSREISLLHTTAYIFSEDLAREGLHHYIAPLNRYRETRGSAFVFVCRGRAREFMEENIPELEISPSKLYELVSQVNRLHGLAPVTQFREFYQCIKSPAKEPVAPLVDINERALATPRPPRPGKLGDHLAGDLPSTRGETQYLGTAVFKGDKMVGVLTGDETRYLNMITGDMEQSFLIIPDPEKPGQPLGLSLRQARRPVIKVRLDSRRPVIEAHIYQEPEIVGIATNINYESTGLKPLLEKHLADIIERRCREVVARAQNEFRSDIFGFGRYARMKFLTLKEWEKYRWEEAFPTAGVEIVVHVKIRRTGLMLKTMPVHF